MADDSLKKLLVRLGLSTQDWQKSVQQIKSELKELQAQSLKDFKERQSNQKIELDSTKQQVAEQQALKAESQAMAAFDSAHAAWLRDQTEAIRQKTAQAILETAELRKQSAEQAALRRTEEEQLRLQQRSLQLEERKTKELDRQRIEAAKVPTASVIQTLRAGVAGAVRSDILQNIQTEALQKQIVEERALLAVKQAQLRVMSEQEGVRKADVEVVQKEIASERTKISLLEAQLRARELQLRELKLEREATGRVPSASGVSALRAGVVGAVQTDVISSLQAEALQKVIAEERAKLSVQESQLRVMSQQEGVRRADVEVVQKEIAAERSKISLLESQLRMQIQQTREIERERLAQEKVPSAVGVSTLRVGTAASIPQIAMSREQIVDAEKVLVAERARLAIQEAQLRLMAQQEGVRRADVSVLQKELEQERARLGVQEAQLRLQHAQVAGGGGEGGGGFFGGALMSLGGGMFGMGLPAMMAAGVAAGQLLERALEKIGEKLREVGQEMLKAAGPAGALREQFEKLAARAGEDPEEFLNKLRVATRGLIDDNAQLVKVANQFMSGPLKLEPDQIVRLTQMTVALARAQGKDATEAMNALSRAALTGQTRMLSWVLGLQRGEMQVRGFGRGVSATAQQQLQLSMMMDAMTRKLAEVGTPMTTLADVFKQVSMAENAFTEDMAYGMTHSEGFSNAIQKVSKWLMDATPHILDFALGIGQKLGVAFDYIEPLVVSLATVVKDTLAPAFTIVSGTLRTFSGVIKSAPIALGALLTVLTGYPPAFSQITEKGGVLTSFFEELSKRASSLSGIFSSVMEVLTLLGSGLQLVVTELSGDVSLMFKMIGGLVASMEGLKEGGVAGMKEAWHNAVVAMQKDSDELTAKEKEQNDALLESIERMENARQGIVKPGPAGPPQPRTTLDPQIEAQRRRLRLQIEQEDAKTRLEIIKQGIADEEEAEKQKYEAGLETLAQFTLAEMALRDRAHKARLDEIEQEKRAKLSELAEEARGQKDPTTGKFVGGMDPGVEALKREQIEKQANLQVEQEDSRHQKETNAKYEGWYNDQLAAERSYVNKVNAIQKQGVSERTKILEEEFKLGGVGADEYIAQRKALINQEAQLAQQAADLAYAAGKKNAEDLAKLRLSYTEAEMQKEKDLQNLELQEASIRLAGAKSRYDQAKEILQSGIDLAREAAGGLITPEQTQLMAQMRDMTREYIVQLREVQARTQPLSKDWADVSREMSRAVQEEIKLNVELAKAKDYAGPLGQLFGTVASDLKELLGQKTSSFLDTISKSLESISKVSTGIAAQMGGAGAMYKGLWTSFKGMFGGAPQKSQTAEDARLVFDRGLRSSAGEMDQFSSVVNRAIGSLVSFADAAAAAATKLTQTGTPTPAGTQDGGLPGPYRPPVAEQSVLSLLGIDVAGILGGGSPSPAAAPAPTPSVQTVFGPPPPPVSPQPLMVASTGEFGGLPLFQTGGVVPETGPAIVHAGEYIIPSDVFSQFIHTLNSFGGRIGGLLSALGGGSKHESETTTASSVSSTKGSKSDRENAKVTVLGGEHRTSTETDRRMTMVRENISRSLEVKFPQLHRVEIERLTEQTITKLREQNMFGPQPQQAGRGQKVQSVPHFQLGGVVPETGTAMVHAGEYVIPSEVFSKFIQALNSFENKIGREGGVGGGTAKGSGPLAAMFGLGKDKKGGQPEGVKSDPWKGVSDKVSGLVRALSDAVAALGKFTAGLAQATSLEKPSSTASAPSTTSPSLPAQPPLTVATGSVIGPLAPGQAPASDVDKQAQADHQASLPENDSTDIKAPATGLAAVFKKLTDSGSDFHAKLTSFTQNLTGAIGQIGGVIKGITGGKTTGQGALSGGMAGLSMGMQFGPMGAAIGAVGGAIMGGIIGHKEEEMQKNVNKLKDQLQSIIDEMNDGTVTMSTTLGQLRVERQQALDLLSHGGGGKKGSKKGTTQQIQAVISQIDQAIQKVIDLQQQALDNMHQQIAELAQTPAYQPIVQQLDEIINKYKEFAAAAAGNAQQMASANEYLTESLQNYATTLSDQLHQANVQAVQDAIQLIDLQQQKNQLDAQAAQQEYDVLTQGVTSRQQSTAMTKGEEIAQIKYQHDQQTQDMDEEIAVAQHKVDAEKQIFDLASTRIGLETQLLALQNETTDKQMLQIEALQQTIAAVTSAIAGGNLPSALMAGGTLSTGSQLLSQLLQLLGLSGEPGQPGSTVGGSTVDQYIAQWFPSEFYALLQNAVGAYPDYLQQIIPALETPPGSSQRQEQVSWFETNLKQSEDAENMPTSDWMNFLNSGQFSGTPPTPPTSYQTGGVVPETGPAIVHAGEYIIPSDIFSQFIQTLNSFGDRLANFMSGGGSAVDSPIPFASPFSDSGSSLLDTHQQIFNLSSRRVAIESNLISLQQATIQMDLQRIQAWKDFLASSTLAGGGVVSLEGAFAQVYEQRGRMGLGGFTRQVL